MLVRYAGEYALTGMERKGEQSIKSGRGDLDILCLFSLYYEPVYPSEVRLFGSISVDDTYAECFLTSTVSCCLFRVPCLLDNFLMILTGFSFF